MYLPTDIIFFAHNEPPDSVNQKLGNDVVADGHNSDCALWTAPNSVNLKLKHTHNCIKVNGAYQCSTMAAT